MCELKQIISGKIQKKEPPANTTVLAPLFGLKLARLVVDTSYSELVGMQRDVERRTLKAPHRR